MKCPKCWSDNVTHGDGEDLDFKHLCSSCGYKWETAFGDLPPAESPFVELRECGPAITPRVFLAGQALEGMLAHARHGHGYRPRLEDDHLHWHGAIAKEACEIADALIAELEREK